MRAEDLRVDVHSTNDRSTVRITHLPTGCVAECAEHSSQLRNRVAAIEMLRERLGEPNPDDELIPITIHLRRSDLAAFIDTWRSYV